MREIKFRGKKVIMEWVEKFTKYNETVGDFVYGSLVDLGGENIFIVIPNEYKEERVYNEAYKEAKFIKVHRETVGQYIGFKDLNNKEIYESDVVKEDSNIAIVKFGKYQANNNRIYNNEPSYGFSLEYLSHKGVIDHATKLSWYEIIGNLYENPELLTK